MSVILKAEIACKPELTEIKLISIDLNYDDSCLD